MLCLPAYNCIIYFFPPSAFRIWKRVPATVCGGFVQVGFFQLWGFFFLRGVLPTVGFFPSSRLHPPPPDTSNPPFP